MRKTLTIIILFLMTYCAYAQNLYIGSFYVTSADEEKLYGDGGDKWTNRMTPICDLFNYEQPDVLGLQSFTESQLSQITRRMTGYSVAGDILYKSSLQLDSCGTVSEMPEGSICSWVRLQKDDKAFYVFNICFSTELSVSVSSASRVRTAITEINPDNLPCFVVGYLGVSESKAPYSRFTVKFNDCFKQAPVVSAEYGTINNFDLEANHGTDRFDFVFASKNNVTVKAYGQLQSAYFTQESGGGYKRRLLSTHFPVMAKVSLSK
ncbi:MAG: hypothetical protein J5524_10495 [Bacteroidaceae bacterium]|nr:hypothetical protein [Bacteroidaceae bacterium]